MALATLGHWFTLMFGTHPAFRTRANDLAWHILEKTGSKETQISSSSPSSESCGSVIVKPTYSAASAMYIIFGHWRSSSSPFTIIRTQGIILYFIVFLSGVVPFMFSRLNLNSSGYAVIPTFTTPPTCHRTPVRGPLEGSQTTVEKLNLPIATRVDLSQEFEHGDAVFLVWLRR
ncbi:hypothetical protein DFJ58DRAFT_843685 [Suillus subalutaceus]|uniref:uncharacterized protein n=1 Tax=Suillus subalutaceus TaxID=48586 RepID=UPI001B8608DB|nr:uncharacterized protein DFJ58DRAFT_843685 [Suillus subalutaceus]KAG1845699.1 hypothetical protein DFJ58DRAFT_843685 [Suillus subalutaceus]